MNLLLQAGEDETTDPRILLVADIRRVDVEILLGLFT